VREEKGGAGGRRGGKSGKGGECWAGGENLHGGGVHPDLGIGKKEKQESGEKKKNWSSWVSRERC